MLKKVAKWKGRIKNGYYPICYLCGKPITRISELSQDHLLPKSRGGLTIETNIEPAHKLCNQHKGSLTYEEWLLLHSDKQRS